MRRGVPEKARKEAGLKAVEGNLESLLRVLGSHGGIPSGC